MNSLKEWSTIISKNLEALKQELVDRKHQTLELLDKVTEEYKKASMDGDRSENAAFEEAVKKASLCNMNLNLLENRYRNIVSKVNEENYVPIGLVTMYSTVKLRSLHDNKEIIIKLYPDGVEDIKRYIVSKSSRVGTALWLKGKGDEISVEHLVTGVPLRYLIEDIY